MAKAPPAFQFYPDVFEQGTAGMTLTEVGAYLRLLNAQWALGSVPGDDVKRLAVIMRCTPAMATRVWAVVREKFRRGDDGGWRNARMERERAKQADYRALQAARGKRSAERREGNRGSTEPQPEGQPEGNRASTGVGGSVQPSPQPEGQPEGNPRGGQPAGNSSSSKEQEQEQIPVVPVRLPSEGRAPPGSLWDKITERLQLAEHNRVSWFAPCSVHRVTENIVEINTETTLRASWLSQHFRRRIAEDCADLLGGRKVVFVVGAH